MQIVNNSTPFQSGGESGVGAVIFDYPNAQPLDMLLKANQDIDNWKIQKAAQAKLAQTERAKMLSDIKFDSKGALAEDIQNTIAPEANKVYELASKVYSLDPSSKEYRDGIVELKNKQAQVDFLINESINHKDQLAAAGKALDPTKFDLAETDLAVALARTKPLKERIEYMKNAGNLIKPRKESLDEIILAGTADAMKHPTTTNMVEENIKGNIVSKETTETIPYDKALTLANGWINNNYKPKGASVGFKDKIYNTVEEWDAMGVDANGLPLNPNARFYLEKAQTYKGPKGETYTPAELYAADQIYKYNAKNIERKGIGSDAYQKEADKRAAGFDADAKEGGSLVDLISGIFQGKPQLFKPKKVVINGVEKDAVSTDALSTYSLGKFPIIGKNEAGQEGIADVIDNMILETLRGPDGRIYVKTTETFNKSLTDPAFKKNPYITFNNETELYNAIGGGLPADKREKILNGGREYAKKAGAYTDATSFDGAKIAKVTPEEKAKMDALYGMTVKTVPNNTPSATPTKEQLNPTPKAEQKAAKKEATIYSKSKSGKDIYSTDGGKTWLYK